MKRLLMVLALASAFASSSCKKPAGEGGQATIRGMVYETNFSMVSGNYEVNDEYYAPDVDVFIIYGDDATYGNKVQTGPDGVFEFKYLRKGSYTVYTYSKDKDASIAGNAYAPAIAVKKTVEITDKKGTVDAGTFKTYQ
jgi:hypothetical protein